jgi:hypothetical protein
VATSGDWDDPCYVVQQLKAAYYRLLSGEQESEVQYLANGVTRIVSYSKISLQDLVNELRNAEMDCAAKQGLGPKRRRFAIQGGARLPY